MQGDSDAEARVRSSVAACLGRGVERIDWMEAGIGLRRFARVALAGAGAPRSVIARIEAPEDPAGRPAGLPPEPPLEPLRTWLERAGLPVPRSYGGEPDGGLLLLEDLGTTTLADAARTAAPPERSALYVEACDLVPRLQRVPEDAEIPAFRRHFENAHFAYKADLLSEWSLASRGRAASAAESAVVRDAFSRIADTARAAPQRLAHRDLQSANLHVVAGRAGGRLVMIDLQGALMAPPEYDLVCLLRDSYFELDAAELDAQLERIRPRLPDAPDPEAFALRFDLLTLTRKAKDHARFLYAAHVRGDERFLRHLPTTTRYLQRAAQRAAARDPRLEALAELIATLPRARRSSSGERACGG